MVATASALVMQRPRKRMLSAIDPEPSMARMNAVRWLRVMLCVYMLRLFKSPDGVVVVAYFPFVVAVEAVADRHVERAVAVAVGVGRTAHRRAAQLWA